MLRIHVLAAALLLAACSHPPAKPANPMPASKVDDAQAAELAKLKATVGFLQDQVKDLEAQVAEANKETTRYQAGLQRAVAELNRCAQSSQARAPQRQPTFVQPAPAPTSPAQPARPARSPARVITLDLPEVTPLGDDVLVSAHLWNSGEQTARGTATITLNLDGREIDSAMIPFTADPGVDVGIQHRFNSPGEGALSANVSLDY